MCIYQQYIYMYISAVCLYVYISIMFICIYQQYIFMYISAVYLYVYISSIFICMYQQYISVTALVCFFVFLCFTKLRAVRKLNHLF